MSKAKQILIHAPNGLFVMKKTEETFGLTTKEYATRFSSTKDVRAAIKYCLKHCCRGHYRYEKL